MIMALCCRPQVVPEVKVITPDVFGDTRGFFQETYCRPRYEALGITATFVQDNWSRSIRGVVRGLHYQLRNAQDKLVWVMRGEIFDVAVDVRRGSPTFGRVVTAYLTEENHYQMYIPAGFAHGFCVLSETVDFCYKCSNVYAPAEERGILWSDPALNIPWPVVDPVVSARDQALKLLAEMPLESLPVYGG
jgi:dTDP-4-dehydrorhamnose 3,5-epimerase